MNYQRKMTNKTTSMPQLAFRNPTTLDQVKQLASCDHRAYLTRLYNYYSKSQSYKSCPIWVQQGIQQSLYSELFLNELEAIHLGERLQFSFHGQDVSIKRHAKYGYLEIYICLNEDQYQVLKDDPTLVPPYDYLGEGDDVGIIDYAFILAFYFNHSDHYLPLHHPGYLPLYSHQTRIGHYVSLVDACDQADEIIQKLQQIC